MYIKILNYKYSGLLVRLNLLKCHLILWGSVCLFVEYYKFFSDLFIINFCRCTMKYPEIKPPNALRMRLNPLILTNYGGHGTATTTPPQRVREYGFTTLLFAGEAPVAPALG